MVTAQLEKEKVRSSSALSIGKNLTHGKKLVQGVRKSKVRITGFWGINLPMKILFILACLSFGATANEIFTATYTRGHIYLEWKALKEACTYFDLRTLTGELVYTFHPSQIYVADDDTNITGKWNVSLPGSIQENISNGVYLVRCERSEKILTARLTVQN